MNRAIHLIIAVIQCRDGIRCCLFLGKQHVRHSSKPAAKSVLYVSQQTFGVREMIRHCLWKVLVETGLIYVEQLTEMESKVLKDLLARKESLCNHSESDLAILNKAVDKIVCHIKNLQVQEQKYNAAIAESYNLKTGLGDLIRIPEHSPANLVPVVIERSIDEVGLSKRTVRLLKAYGVDTLEQLKVCSLSRLQKQVRVGVKTIHEIETILGSYFSQASAER